MDVLRISIRRVEREREGGELRMVVFGVFVYLRFSSSIFFWKELNQGNQV